MPAMRETPSSTPPSRPDCCSAALTTKRPMKSTSSVPVDQPEHLARGHLRDTSRTPAAASATTSRGATRTGSDASPRADHARPSSSASDRTPAHRSTHRQSECCDASDRDTPARGRPTPRPARAAPGTAASDRYRANERSSTSPISMFCGLPISVPAEPTLEAQASASRNGTGSRPRRAHTSTSTGAMARQTMSLASIAESAPAVRTTSASSAAGVDRRRPGARVTRCRSRPAGTAPRPPSGRRAGRWSARRSRPRRPASVMRPDGDQRDRAEQRDAGAVQLRPGNSPRIMPRYTRTNTPPTTRSTAKCSIGRDQGLGNQGFAARSDSGGRAGAVRMCR